MTNRESDVTVELSASSEQDTQTTASSFQRTKEALLIYCDKTTVLAIVTLGYIIAELVKEYYK